ncbi:MAG: hypothetical protein ACJAVK_000438 [Akkermansiaceae bacterium]
MFSVNQDLLFVDGSRFDKWVLLEDGIFNPREVFERVRDDSKKVQMFPAPMFVFLDILLLVEVGSELPHPTTVNGPVSFRSNHPDLGGGEWKDLYEVSYMLREGGSRGGDE